MAREPERLTGLALAERHDALLLDAYGVLVASGEALADAGAFLAGLRERDVGFYVVTNDASRTPARAAE